MAVKKSFAQKRHEQSEVRRFKNKSARSAVRTSVKKFVALINKKEYEEAQLALQEMVKKLDSAAQKGVMSKNTAARKKSRMQKLYNKMTLSK